MEIYKFRHPTEPIAALMAGYRFWTDTDGCASCGDEIAVRYVLDNACRTCTMMIGGPGTIAQLCEHGSHRIRKVKGVRGCATCNEAGRNARARALAAGQLEYIPERHCRHCHTLFWRDVTTGRCLNPLCTINGPTPRQAAIQAGKKWYTPDKPCHRCWTTAPRHVDNGRCSNCDTDKTGRTSARQAALEAGEKWYTPETPCKRCGTYSRRYVANGRCYGCTTITIDGVRMTRAMAAQFMMI